MPFFKQPNTDADHDLAHHSLALQMVVVLRMTYRINIGMAVQ